MCHTKKNWHLDYRLVRKTDAPWPFPVHLPSFLFWWIYSLFQISAIMHSLLWIWSHVTKSLLLWGGPAWGRVDVRPGLSALHWCQPCGCSDEHSAAMSSQCCFWLFLGDSGVVFIMLTGIASAVYCQHMYSALLKIQCFDFYVFSFFRQFNFWMKNWKKGRLSYYLLVKKKHF